MKHLKKFNESEENKISITESDIENYLKQEYTSDWFNEQLSERAYDYLDSDDVEEYDNDYELAYKSLAMGGAIEYDLIDEMSRDTSKHFNINQQQKIDKRSILDITHDHVIDTCTWCDKFVFNRKSTEPYKSFLGTSYDDLAKNFND